jgi:curved DNA-binding protein CbpA
MPLPLPNYYAVLGVPTTAELEHIRSAYRRLVRLYHPDVNRQERDGSSIKRINEAYAVLSDPMRRASYDIQLLEERKRAIIIGLIVQQRERVLHRPKRMTWAEGAQGFVRELKRGIRGES